MVLIGTMQLPRDSQVEENRHEQQHLQQPCQPTESQTLTPKHEDSYANNNNGPNDIFMAKSAMQMHARDAHRSETKPHQCQQCLKSFSSNHQLVQHIRVHTGEKPYRCSYCDRRFKQLSHVQQHTRLHTGERPYRCHVPECGRAFIQLSNLQQHLRNHDAQLERAKNRPFQCAICGKGFATESSLRTHTAKQHAALIGGPNTTCCSLCHKLFLGNDALLEHMKHVHKDAAPGPSSMTGESSADNMGGPGSSAASLMMPHQHSLGPPQPGPSLLSQQQGLQPVPSGLGNTTDPSAWVVAPSSVKRRAPTHACPVCGKHYVNEGSLRKHLAAHPETAHITSALRMWPCSICPAVFPHETGLLSHMEQMRMEPKHQFAAQYMLSRAAAERRFRDRGESPGPGPSVSSGGAGSSSAGHDDSANQVIDASSGPSPPAPASPVPTGAPQQGLLGHSNRLTSPPGRSPVPQGSMGTHGMAHAQGPMQLGDGMQGTGEMEDEAGGTALTPEEAAVARRLQAAGVEAVLRLAAASATGAGVGVSVGVGVPSASSVSYPDSRLEQAIRLHQALGFALPQPHPLHLHQQQIQFQQHQQHQQHHQQPLQQQQQQQPLHLGQPQHGPQSYHHQANQHHLQHQQPPQGH